jgi:hypothetical protein
MTETTTTIRPYQGAVDTYPPSIPPSNHSIVPDSGYFGNTWPANGSIPSSFSSAGWTMQARGFQQQTFLGASIRSFSMNGGFGDSSSTLSVELVNDEFNQSDKTPAGFGDDVYHSGLYDLFAPPPVGSPVFFKFGQNLATVEESYRKTFDDLYDYDTLPDNNMPAGGGAFDPINFSSLADNTFVDLQLPTSGQYINLSSYLSSPSKGEHHLVFGGILQSYTQNRGPGGDPLYSVQVTDPREILANTILILNNYAGTVFNNKNILNIYGFLEYNVSLQTLSAISGQLPLKSSLSKYVMPNGEVIFMGDDTYYRDDEATGFSPTSLPKSFPTTGTGFSRRGQQGLPYYRLKQAINTLMGYNGAMPPEYYEKSFGGCINFRGHNYVVDFGSLPALPNLYYFDFDQINLLELALEICDITSKELFVSLLPVIDHPASKYLFNHNNYYASADRSKLIAGVIRLDAIDRSKPPQYGSIKKYIDGLASSGIYVENQDVGFELSNITTDKFIVGAQEVDMYYFSTNSDRDRINDAKVARGQGSSTAPGYQWKLDTSLKQQVLPFYGTLGKNAVTIPKGFGAYQQILLDATSLNANGVGSYYVATEMELRCALISFERWKEFLKMYNDIYMESVEQDDAQDSANLLSAAAPPNSPPIDDISNNYAVTVPRSVFNTYAPSGFGSDNLPYSACNPPYGYPLYYKRMTKIGIPEGGLTEIQTRFTSIVTGLANLKSADKSNFKHILNSEFARLRELAENSTLSTFEQQYFDDIERLLENATTEDDINNALVLVEEAIENFKPIFFSPDLTKIAKKNTQNALKVYNFVRNVAEECLGKKFLVKIPKEVNLFYENKIAVNDPQIKDYKEGPFGFKPRPISSGAGYEFSKEFHDQVVGDRGGLPNGTSFIESFLSSGVNPNPTRYAGALSVNYNPISDRHEFSYYPSNEGGFFNFDLYQNTLAASQINLLNTVSGYVSLPGGVQQQLIPIDLTNFITDNGRVTPYVRFDHSQHLSFDGFSASDFTQQIITAEGMIPDLSENLDNVKGDEFHKFPEDLNNPNNSPAQTQRPPEQVAFLKCTIDDKLYMPPKTSLQQTSVHAQTPKQIKRKTLPRKIYKPCEDKFVDSFSYYKSHFTPNHEPGTRVSILDFNAASGIQIAGVTLEGKLIKTDLEDLDTEHVYALITLPGRVIPTKDARFRDGPFQTSNAERFKHYMTMDTVTGLEGFDTPGCLNAPPKSILKQFNCQTISSDVRVQSYMAAKKANDSLLSFGFPQTLNAALPSPVYPDLVALPLMSQERCYGPWISSQLDVQAQLYTNIGGRIEFIKDENLSPWNYSGYYLMHEAGRLQAEFSNSLLLFSERGGFVVPSAPQGSSLGKALLDGGPLVTNIQVDVSDAGVKTTYKLDLYTSSFGKLQKQKQDEISKISRERQKLRDERNALIRKGLGKNQNTTNYGQQYEQLNRNMNASIANGGMTTITQGVSSAMTTFSMTSRRFTSNRWSSEGNFGSSNGNYGRPPGDHEKTDFTVEGSILPNGAVGEVMQNYMGEDGLAQSYANSAAIPITQMYIPATNEPLHPNMASRPDPFPKAKKSLYFNEDTPFTEDDVV